MAWQTLSHAPPAESDLAWHARYVGNQKYDATITVSHAQDVFGSDRPVHQDEVISLQQKIQELQQLLDGQGALGHQDSNRPVDLSAEPEQRTNCSYPPDAIHNRTRSLRTTPVPGLEDLSSKMTVTEANYVIWKIDKLSINEEKCNLLFSTLATEFGHIPITSLEDWSIKLACDPLLTPALPTELRSHLIIQRFMQSATNEINSFGPISTRNLEKFYTMMARLEHSFNFVRSSLPSRLSWITGLRLQAASLYLSLTYFLDDTSGERRTAGILGAYNIAAALISDLILGDDLSYDLLPHAPLSVARWIFCAALVLFRVVCSSMSLRVDGAAAKVAYNAAAFAIRKLSICGKRGSHLLRIPTRLSDILRALWRRGEKDTALCSQEPRLRVKTRLGNNLQADCMMLLHYYRMAEIGGNAPHVQVQSAKSTVGAQSSQQGEDCPPSSATSTSPLYEPFPTMSTDITVDMSLPRLNGDNLEFVALLDPFSDMVNSEDTNQWM
ncbi:MAG: hypothetical protein Q9165_005124 [Trypethelium subeluteriae]